MKENFWRVRILSSVILAVIVLFGYTTAMANLTLDQSLEPGETLTFKSGVGGSLEKAQTFTVGITGQLTRIDILVNRQAHHVDGDLLFDVRPTFSGVPVEQNSEALANGFVAKEDVIVGTGSFDSSDFQWITIDISPFNVFVNEGELLAIVLRSSGADEWSDYRWGGYNTNPYSRGMHFFRGTTEHPEWTSGRGPNPGAENLDTCFRTFVTPLSEPITILENAITDINDLPLSAFKNRNMPIPFTNKINKAIEMINQSLYLDAINKLQNDILKKMDGCATVGYPDRNDWIIDCESQDLVYPIIVDTIILLINKL